MKFKDISKFEKLNPSLPGINVFSVSDNNKFYPLTMAENDEDKIAKIQLIYFYMNKMVNHIILL